MSTILLYSSRKASKIITNSPDIGFIKNLIKKGYVKELTHNQSVADYQMSHYDNIYINGLIKNSYCIFYHVSYVNEFKRKILVFKIDTNTSRTIISKTVAKAMSYGKFTKFILTSGKPIKSFIMNIKKGGEFKK